MACLHIYTKGISKFAHSRKRTIANAPLPRLTVSSPSLLSSHHFILQVSSLMAVKGLRSLNWPWPANIWFTVDDIVLEKQNFCPEAKLHLMIYMTSHGPGSGVFTNTVRYFNSSRSPIDFGGTLPRWGTFTIGINIPTCGPLIRCHDSEDKFFDHF